MRKAGEGAEVEWAWLQRRALRLLELRALDFEVSERDRSYLPLRRDVGESGGRDPEGRDFENGSLVEGSERQVPEAGVSSDKRTRGLGAAGRTP